MNYKILPYKTNKNGYFPADTVTLSILDTYNDQISFLYGFYNLFAFECNYMDGSIIYNVELDWNCPTLCRKEMPRSVLQNISNISFIDFIISSINEGYYIYITLDSGKINCYHIKNIDFIPHPLIIYGYNQSQKEFYIADYFNGTNYSDNVMSYAEINAANSSLLSQMIRLDSLCGTNDSILDIELIKYLKNCNIILDKDYIRHSLSLFLEGRWVTGNTNCFIQNRTLPRTAIDGFGNSRYYEATTFNEKYGINAFWGIVQHLENCISSDKYMFNFRHIQLISLYYELFIKKIFILKQELPYLDTMEHLNKILSDVNVHKEILQTAVSLSLKYTLKKQQGINNIDYLVRVNNIVKEETQYIYDINYIIRNSL